MDASDGTLTAASAKGMSKEAASYANTVLARTFKESMTGADGETSEGFAAEARQLENLSVADKRKLAGTLGGVLGGEAGYEASIETRLGKSRKGRAGAVGDVLGVSLDPAELKRLGGNNDEIAKMIAKNANLGDGADMQKELVAALTGKKGVAAGALARITESDEFKAAKDKKKMDAAADANPLEKAISDNTKRANDLLTVLVKLQTGGTAALAQIAQQGVGDPEQNGRGGGTFHNAPKDKS
jgi:hypothetical protein